MIKMKYILSKILIMATLLLLIACQADNTCLFEPTVINTSTITDTKSVSLYARGCLKSLNSAADCRWTPLLMHSQSGLWLDTGVDIMPSAGFSMQIDASKTAYANHSTITLFSAYNAGTVNPRDQIKIVRQVPKYADITISATQPLENLSFYINGVSIGPAGGQLSGDVVPSTTTGSYNEVNKVSANLTVDTKLFPSGSPETEVRYFGTYQAPTAGELIIVSNKGFKQDIKYEVGVTGNYVIGGNQIAADDSGAVEFLVVNVNGLDPNFAAIGFAGYDSLNNIIPAYHGQITTPDGIMRNGFFRNTNSSLEGRLWIRIIDKVPNYNRGSNADQSSNSYDVVFTKNQNSFNINVPTDNKIAVFIDVNKINYKGADRLAKTILKDDWGPIWPQVMPFTSSQLGLFNSLANLTSLAADIMPVTTKLDFNSALPTGSKVYVYIEGNIINYKSSINPSSPATISSYLWTPSWPSRMTFDVDQLAQFNNILTTRLQPSLGAMSNSYQDNLGSYPVLITYPVKKPQGFVSDFIWDQVTSLQNTLRQYMQLSFEGFTSDSHYYKKIVNTCLVLYIALYAIYFVIGLVEVKQIDVVIRICKVGVISALMTPNAWNFFNTYLFTLFNEGAQYITQYASGLDSGNLNLFSWVDAYLAYIFDPNMWKQIGAIALQGFPDGTCSGIIAIIVILYTFYAFVLAVAEAAIAYMMILLAIALSISLAPIFIIFFLFSTTKPLFDNWIKFLFNASIQPAILFTVITLLAKLFLVMLQNSVAFNDLPNSCWSVVFTPHLPLVPWLGSIADVLGLPTSIPLHIFDIYYYRPSVVMFLQPEFWGGILGCLIMAKMMLNAGDLAKKLADSLVGGGPGQSRFMGRGSVAKSMVDSADSVIKKGGSWAVDAVDRMSRKGKDAKKLGNGKGGDDGGDGGDSKKNAASQTDEDKAKQLRDSQQSGGTSPLASTTASTPSSGGSATGLVSSASGAGEGGGSDGGLANAALSVATNVATGGGGGGSANAALNVATSVATGGGGLAKAAFNHVTAAPEDLPRLPKEGTRAERRSSLTNHPDELHDDDM